MNEEKYVEMLEDGELYDYITNLQQENERLKTKTKEQSLLLIDYQDMEQKLEDYKSRIEKAIPMLKELNIKLKGILSTGIDIKEISDIEDTLNGRSDE